MSTAFDKAAGVLFANRDRAIDVVYTVAATGETRDIRAIRAQPTRSVQFLSTEVSSGTTTFHVRLADLADPVEGDTVTVGPDVYTVQGVPRTDDIRAWWLLDTARTS